jgi:glycosyltransferase involved in cell wall biosynthesis
MRDNKKMIYCSSYDRGLELILERWDKIKKAVPKANLTICYGWNNFDKDYAGNQQKMEWKEKMDKMMRQEGITHLGRIGHPELDKEMQSSGVWLYPAHFQETNCISAKKAMASGSIPVCNDYGALGETVKFGIITKSSDFEMFNMPEEEADEIINNAIELLNNDKRQEEIRKPMMDWAKKNLGWDKVAIEWSKGLL